jgi:1-phosphofructokinase family hexose kinase
MFLCVSPNPAIDKRLAVPALLRGRMSRVSAVRSFPGGKAVHVAMVLQTLGAQPHWIGPCGGRSGEELKAGLSSLGIRATACPTSEPTRTNLEIVEGDGTVTEILESGSPLSSAEWEQFESACGRAFAENSENKTVILSGSLPPNARPDLYADLVARARQSGCKTLLDTSGEPLRLALAAEPDFVKPNREEAGQVLGAAVNTISDACAAIYKLLALGARSAALSVGSEGLLFCARKAEPVLFAPVIPLQPGSTVGCGDSALAGFAFRSASAYSPQDRLRLAAACAAANCLADSPGAARLEDIERFRHQIGVQTLASDSRCLL